MSTSYFVFEITYADGFKEEHKVEEPVLAIGRLPVRTDIHINDSKLSGRHAEIRFHDNQITVWDLGSTNGTYFKGEKQTEEFRLSPGESFELGSISVKIVSINGETLNDARTMMGISPFAEEDNPSNAQAAPAHQPTAWEA